MKLIIVYLFLALLIPTVRVRAAESDVKEPQKNWNISAGAALILAPAFTGAKEYSLLAVPDIRVAYKDLFFANVRDGVGYAVIHEDGWRIGPVVSYAFRRSEKRSGNIFRVAGSSTNALEGMGDVPGTVSLGGFAEYSLKPYKVKLNLYKGVTGHEGVVGEVGISYGGVLTYNGPPLIYSFGPHITYGDQKYTNAYWGISPEQSVRTGLDQYHADAGITAYGIKVFTLIPWTKAVSVSVITGFDRFASPITHSPLIKARGAESQVFGGVIVNHGF